MARVSFGFVICDKWLIFLFYEAKARARGTAAVPVAVAANVNAYAELMLSTHTRNRCVGAGSCLHLLRIMLALVFVLTDNI